MNMASNQSTITPIRDFAVEAARLARDLKCENVLLLDVRGLSHVCDYVLIATGTSEKQMKSVAEDLEDLGAEQQHSVFRSNRDTGSTWIIIDFVDLVAHLFEPSHRAYYDLEALWSDAKKVAWERDAKPQAGPGADG
jgi:ribosome-associated protein